MRHTTSLAVALTCFLTLFGESWSADREESTPSIRLRLHDYLAARSQNGDFFGTVAIEKRNKLLYSESFGFSDFENHTPFVRASRFEVASLTKTFTAAAISILMNRQKLSLDTTLDEFFPDFPHAREIKIRHLLSHSSGLGELPAGPWTARSHTLQEVVGEIGKQPFLFTPGTSERYSNSGFVMLAAIIEAVSRKPYGEFLHETLFAPLGMNDTGDFSALEILPGRVHKYEPGPPPSQVWNVPVEDLSYAVGAGSASSSADDLLLWLRAIREHALFSRPAGEYPYGWHTEKDFGRDAVSQTGLHAGASASILTMPAEKLDIVCLSNIETGFFSQCAQDLGAIVLGQNVPAPLVHHFSETPSTEVRCFEGEYRANERLAFALRVSGHFLVFSWLDSPRDNFVQVIGPDRLYLPSQSSDLTVEQREPSCEVKAILWKSSFDELHFARLSGSK